ncbi:MAG TPA: PRC-barrel domain-containing protein [Chitinispirillaceae bacterium]|nr:PRC-barrel domain-containing protein [Chitinispirillaceae bacterium]
MLWKTETMKGLQVLPTVNSGSVTIEQFLFEDQSWIIRYLVIQIRSHQSYMRKLVSPLSIQKISRHTLYLNMTFDLLENSPEFDNELPVSRQMEEALLKYYSWPCYWLYPEGYNLLGGALYPGLSVPFAYPAANGEDQQTDILSKESHLENTSDSSHLRLTNDVKGYRIIAPDGEVGQVVEFLIDDKNWVLKYLVVDTGHALPGRKVVLPSQLVKKVEWASTAIYLSCLRKVVIDSPLFDMEYPFASEYESRVMAYYYPENK